MSDDAGSAGGTVHEKEWFAGYWRCEVCHVTVASPEGEPDECPSHPTRSGYPDDIETEWEPLVQAAQLPPEDHFGEIECARCGEVFVERNDGVTWLCQNTDCMGHITAREPPAEVLAEPNDVPDTEQTTLIPDGGRVEKGADRPDPTEDPRACSMCGVYIGALGGDYCDGCAREIGAKPPLRRCVHCGQRGPEEDMKPIDVSGPDEYYPKFEYLCRSCSGGEGSA